MTLRHLVPALGVLACTAGIAAAADHTDVTWSGWVDAIGKVGDDNSSDVPGTARDESKPFLRFDASASVKARWQVTDNVSAKINLWLYPISNQITDTDVREAYAAWNFSPDLTWTMGKYINHIGWIAAEPTGLYTVFPSTIGYHRVYGNDVLGTAITCDPKGSPFSGSLHLTRGYFSPQDENTRTNFVDTGRENDDFGLGLDLIYTPTESIALNLDAAWDKHHANTAERTFGVRSGYLPNDFGAGSFDGNGTYAEPGVAVGGMGGDAYLVGLNATIKPAKPWTLGAEILYFHTGENETAAGAKVANSDYKRIQELVAANYAFDGASTPFPMSVTGMVQHIDGKDGADVKGKATEFAVALLTNPVKSPNFGLNYQIDYATADSDQNASAHAWMLAVEALVTF